MTSSLSLCVLLALLLSMSPSHVMSQFPKEINSFEVNLIEFEYGSAEQRKSPPVDDISPPASPQSSFKWVASNFGQCFGCGSKSYKQVTHDCVHRLPMQLTVGKYSRALTGVFKAPEQECLKRGISAPAPVNVFGCGPPCSDVRLLRGGKTGCRCNHRDKISYDVPRLVCQDNRNRTVSLALCKFFFEKNPKDYDLTVCDYGTLCVDKIDWIAGNWSACSHKNSVHQTRDIICASQSPRSPVYYVMHESMCPAERKPEKMQFCARWAIERNFVCNCATRTATRRVVCLRSKRAVLESECSWHVKPSQQRDCDEKQLKDCSVKF